MITISVKPSSTINAVSYVAKDLIYRGVEIAKSLSVHTNWRILIQKCSIPSKLAP